jgi:SAM-dependent methyltransferase
VGAGRSLSIEDQLTAAGVRFVGDRVDVEDCRVEDPRVGACWTCSVEAMEPVPSGRYDAAFANYVLEHVPEPGRAAGEIFRVLRPGGFFVASFPNPRAPEFRVAAATPLAFHRWLRGEEAWPTLYAYRSVEGLLDLFRASGFRVAGVDRFAFLEGYLGRFPGLGALARAYDRAVTARRPGSWAGNACAAFEKPPAGEAP